MIKNAIQTLNKHYYTIVFAVLLFIAVFNGFNNIGLWQDGGWCIYEMFQDGVSIDYSRMFAHICLHVPAFCLNFLGLNNAEFLKTIIVSHGIWFFLLPLIPLMFSLFVLPEDKKNWFVVPLVSYLITMIFSSYFIASEMYVTISLFWLVLMIFLFVDFKTMSVATQIILLASSFILIRSYQVSAVLSLLLLIAGISNFYVLKKQISWPKKIVLCLSFSFIAGSVAVSFYYILNPVDTNVSKVLDNLKVVSSKYFIYYFLAAFAASIVNYKNKYLKIAVVLILTAVSYKFMLNNFEILKNAHDLRHLAVIFAMFFSLILIVIRYFGKNINFNLWKAVCVVMLCLHLLNSIAFTNKINVMLKDIPNALAVRQDNIVFTNVFLETFSGKDIIIDTFIFPRQAVLAQVLYGGDRVIYKILIDEKRFSDMQDYFNVTNDNLMEQLKKFGINYSSALTDEINKIKTGADK